MYQWMIVCLIFVALHAPWASADITTGLRLYLTCDEASGNAADSSGLGNTATATGGATHVAGQTNFGNACFCNSTTDYWVVANEANFDFDRTSPFSLAAWIKPTAADTAIGIVLAKAADSGTYIGWHWILNFDGSGNVANSMTLMLANNAGSTMLSTGAGGTAVNNGSWHHYVWTYTGSGTQAGLNLYQDGILYTLANTGNTLGTNSILNNVAVGMCARSDGAPTNHELFGGALDEVRVYNIALTQAQVTELFTFVPGGAPVAQRRPIVY